MTFEGTDNGQPKTSSFQSVEEYVKSPAAKRTTVTGMNASSGNATATPEENTFQMIEVNGKQFVQFGTTCMQQTASEAPRAASMLNPSDIIGSVHGAPVTAADHAAQRPSRPTTVLAVRATIRRSRPRLCRRR